MERVFCAAGWPGPRIESRESKKNEGVAYEWTERTRTNGRTSGRTNERMDEHTAVGSMTGR